MKRRHFILLLGGASSGALGIGTGAFSSVEADRGVEVNVVEDENAYLGLKRLPAADSVTVGDETDVVKITNQFADGLDLSVIIDEQGGGIDEIEVEDPVEIVDEADEDESDGEDLPTGIKAHVSVKCDSPGDTSFTLTFSGHAGGASVDKTRTFSIHCDPEENDETATGSDVTDSITGVKFNGGSEKIRILTTENNGGGGGTDGNVKAKLYCEDGGDVSSSDGYEEVPVNEDLRIGDFDDDDLTGSIVGVEIDGISGVYLKPDNPGKGSGNGNVVNEPTENPY